MPSVEDLDDILVCNGSEPVTEISDEDFKAIEEFKQFLRDRYRRCESSVVE